MHIAAHGIFDPEAPESSRLLLAPGGGNDGRLDMMEIFDDLDLVRL